MFSFKKKTTHIYDVYCHLPWRCHENVHIVQLYILFTMTCTYSGWQAMKIEAVRKCFYLIKGSQNKRKLRTKQRFVCPVANIHWRHWPEHWLSTSVDYLITCQLMSGLIAYFSHWVISCLVVLSGSTSVPRSDDYNQITGSLPGPFHRFVFFSTIDR